MSDFINRPQIEVLSAADGVRRRHWPVEDKLRIVEESFVGHGQATATARRHGVCRSLLTVLLAVTSSVVRRKSKNASPPEIWAKVGDA